MFKKVKRWLEKMAELNEKHYGNQKLDCCGMNRNSLYGRAKKPVAHRQLHTTSQ
ncbi:MAG: LDCC motif putative metal-binding protein [Calditrichota bacterium]